MPTAAEIKRHQEEFLAHQKARTEAANFTIEGLEIVVNPEGKMLLVLYSLSDLDFFS